MIYKHCGIILGLLLLASCTSSSFVKSSQNPLDKAIRYTEVPLRESPIPLSGANGDSSQVPNGTEVDINSTILIHVDTEAIKLAGASRADLLSVYPNQRARKLADTLSSLSAVINARLDAVNAYEKTRAIPIAEVQKSIEFKVFNDAVSTYGQLRTNFYKLPIWDDGTFNQDDVDQIFGDKTFKKVGELLQKELDAVRLSYQQIADSTNKNTGSLRFQAFLEHSGSDPTPIHLDGYDSFPKHDVTLKTGSVMNAEDRKVFEAQWAQTVQIAEQAEKVRTGEGSLNDAIEASGATSLNQLVKDVADFKPLLDKDWVGIAGTFKTDIHALSERSREILKKHGQEEKLWLQTKGNVSFPATIFKELPVTAVKKVVDEVMTLRQKWTQVRPETLVATFNETKTLKSQIEQLGKSLQTVRLPETQKLLENTLVELEQKPVDISTAVWRDLEPEIKNSQSYRTIQDIRAQVQALTVFCADAMQLLGFANAGEPAETGLKSVEVRDVPLPEASDTEIALTRTARTQNDRIAFSATLKLGDSEMMNSNSLFSVQYFGWHSVLAPSVVLAKPFNPQGPFDSDFKFAPAVALLYSYYPRNTDNGFWSNAARFLQIGIGPHAAFLSQNAQSQSEIGLGATLSFGRDIFVAGAGVNFMNSSKGYFFFGSNLIPILQALGYGQSGGTGVKH